MAKEIAEEYASSLADLTVNSKPLINMLTILAEENIDHAGVIVDTVEKHLEKVNPDIKLPVLYLVDSIIKNVGGAYTQKFSQSIVNMFTRTFKQVDEKIRAQMFKLRETWHDVFPATKLYQLDVKVNLIDPAWPIQAQPQQSNIHVNPNFLKKPATSAAPTPTPDEEEKMRSILAKKEQELLMLQKKKVEMELEHMKRQMDIDKTATKKVPTVAVSPQTAAAPPASAPDAPVSVKQRLGPPVSKSSRIAPVSAALAGARRDPRLARLAPAPAPAPAPAAPILSNVFDIKPLERVTKRKNVITIDVHADGARRRDPRLDKRPRRRDDHKKTDDTLAEEYKKTDDRPTDKTDKKADERAIEGYIDKLQLADPKRINRLPPIPKLPRDQRPSDPAPKRKKDLIRDKKKKREDKEKEKDKDSSGSGSSPDKKNRIKEAKRKKEPRIEAEPEVAEEVIAFKELRNYHKERYMRRNRDKSFSPDRPAQQPEHDANRPEVIVENKDVDLRVLPVVDPKPAPVAQKRSSTEAPEVKAKKNKLDKFDILFGNEDVDLRQLPQVEEVIPPPPPPCLTESPASPSKDTSITEEEDMVISPPPSSPKKDWNEVKGKKGGKSTPSQLDLVRAKLAEATKGKDRLGRRLLSKSPSVERERRRTMSAEDMDMRENGEQFDPEAQRNSITVILSQAKEQFSDGSLDKNQYKELMYQVLQLNEQLKLNQAKQRESLELSKRKLHAHLQDTPGNTFGDIDERVTPAPPAADCDMRADAMPYMPPPPAAPVFPPVAAAPFPQAPWQPRPRLEDFGPRRFRGSTPFFRAKFDSRGPRIPFEQRMPVGPPLPTPQLGTWQGDSPLRRYERCESPPPLGAPGFPVPPTDYTVVDFVDRDPVKTIQIDGIPREIRFYGDTAIIMLDWDDPREIKFLPGCRRVTFDNKDSVVLSFNEGYKTVELEDQVFDIKFGAPTRELYINGRWHECCFGGPPLGVIVDGKARLLHLEGPLPQVDIGKDKRLDLVAGKINLIVDATQICSVYLDAKVQKFVIDNQVLTLRFADALRTVLINEQPFKVEFGDLPKPLLVGSEKHFVRFSALPRHVKPGFAQIVGMEGSGIPIVPPMPPSMVKELRDEDAVMEIDDLPARPLKTPSPEGNAENQGLDLLASVMPTTMDFAPGSDYSVGEPLFSHTDNKIPGLETPADEKPPTLPILGNINVTDLFAKLVATGIVQANVQTNDSKDFKEKTEDVKQKPKEDRSIIHPVDLLKPDTLRIKQPGVVARLYGGMQCSGCGARFAPEHTVRYSQHLDWHFRQNRRERDSTRRAHSRHWHYDLADWLQYEEHDTLHDTEKNWFEATGEEAEAAPAAPEAPSVAAGAPAAAHCALCGDAFRQFYNEDQEEWHLHNSVRHEHENYHPMCLNDYKASLTKEEGTKDLEIQSIEVLSEEKPVAADEEAIVIKDVEDEPGSEHSDNESVVEVLDTTDKQEPVEIEEGEEDDVIYKAEPVEQVDVRDDSDTDDDTQRRRCQRDTLAAAILRIKREPVDPDDEPIITEAEQTPVETTVSTTVLSSIDGNVQFETTPAPLPSLPLGGIRINISKTFASIQNATPEDSADEEPLPPGEEPLPPGEEPELEYKLKPSLADVEFSRQPPVHRGSELSGLCSIM